MTGSVQMLINGEWVDVSNTVRGFEFDESTAIVDEAQMPASPLSFELSMSIDPDDGARLFAMIEEAERRERAERWRRRLWLRFPHETKT